MRAISKYALALQTDLRVSIWTVELVIACIAGRAPLSFSRSLSLSLLSRISLAGYG